MKDFLEQVAEDLLAHWGPSGLKESVIFFPSARARVHFVRHLQTHSKELMWLPSWGEVAELMERVTGLRIVEPLHLAGRVYEWAVEHGMLTDSESEAQRFEDFLPWALTLIRDFDQVDKYRVDARALFLNLKDLREMDRPSDYLSEEQKRLLTAYFDRVLGNGELSARYRRIWERMHELYAFLHEEMVRTGRSYEGAILRRGVEMLLDGEVDLIRDGFLPPRVAFVGFNALNACEQVLLAHVRHRAGDARYYWNYAQYLVESSAPGHDARAAREDLVDLFGEEPLQALGCTPTQQERAVDLVESFRAVRGEPRYFLRRPREEAGLFIAQNLERLPSALGPEASQSLHGAQDIRLYSTPTILSQAEVLADILEELNHEGVNWSRTVVILPDESLLFPVLQHLPLELASSKNVTMGFPLRATPAYSLVGDLGQYLRLRGEGLNASPELLDRIRLNPLVQDWLDDLGQGLEAQAIDRKQEVLRLLHALEEEARAHGSISGLQLVLRTFAEAWPLDGEREHGTKHLIWRAAVHTTYSLLENLAQTLTDASLEATPSLVSRLMLRDFAREKFPIKGNALDGLQVMGFLETRALDFDQVIILSCNEAFLPGTTPEASFIFPSLQKIYGLPARSDREAMYAYYFHMGIARARRVDLIFVENEGLEKEGERSRYLLQMQHLWELGEGSLREIHYHFTPTPSTLGSGDVPKTGLVLNTLQKLLVGRDGPSQCLSPSAIKYFLECPMRFYFSRIARIRGREPEETGEFSPTTFGDIVHRTLESLYSALVPPPGNGPKPLTEADFEDLLTGERVESTVMRVASDLLAEAVARRRMASRMGQDDEDLAPEATSPPPLPNGLQRLQLELIGDVVRNVIRTDLASLRGHGDDPVLVAILGMEETHGFTLELPGRGCVRIEGNIDRIDLVQRADGSQAIRVVDYKTGRLHVKNITFRGVEDLLHGSRPDGTTAANVLQVMLYCDMLADEGPRPGCPEPKPENLIPALFHVVPGKGKDGLRDPSRGILQGPCVRIIEPEIGKRSAGGRVVNSYSEHREALLQQLTERLKDLFDPKLPFARLAPKERYRCEHCDFLELCRPET